MRRPRKKARTDLGPTMTNREGPEALQRPEIRQLYRQLTDHARFDEIASLRSSRTRAGLNPEYAAANTRRDRGGAIDHDPTEGLPVRKWEYKDVTVNQNPKPVDEPSARGYVFPNENYPWSELPLPKDFHSLAPHVQHILRRARAGNTFIKKPPTAAANGQQGHGNSGVDGAKPTSPALEEADAPQNNNKHLLDEDRAFSIRRWAPSTRQDLPEKSFLAPRRPGLPPLYGHNVSAVGTNGTAVDARKKTVKVKKTDPDTGASKIYDVVILEGTEHTISGQILPAASSDPVIAVPSSVANLSVQANPSHATNSASSTAAPVHSDNTPTETLAPGTVIEGVGVANEEGVVVAPAAAAAMSTLSAGAQETNRRRPPPPKRKKFGPGRGKKGPMKKVVFEGEGGVAVAADKQGETKKEGEEEGEGEGDDEEGEVSEEGEIDEGDGPATGNADDDTDINAPQDEQLPTMTLDAPATDTLPATATAPLQPPALPTPSEIVPQALPGLDISNDTVAQETNLPGGEFPTALNTMSDVQMIDAPEEAQALNPIPELEPSAQAPVENTLLPPTEQPPALLLHAGLPPKPPTPLPEPDTAPVPGTTATLAPPAPIPAAPESNTSAVLESQDITLPPPPLIETVLPPEPSAPSPAPTQPQFEVPPAEPQPQTETEPQYNTETAAQVIAEGEAAAATSPPPPPIPQPSSLPPKPVVDATIAAAEEALSPPPPSPQLVVAPSPSAPHPPVDVTDRVSPAALAADPADDLAGPPVPVNAEEVIDEAKTEAEAEAEAEADFALGDVPGDPLATTTAATVDAAMPETETKPDGQDHEEKQVLAEVEAETEAKEAGEAEVEAEGDGDVDEDSDEAGDGLDLLGRLEQGIDDDGREA